MSVAPTPAERTAWPSSKISPSVTPLACLQEQLRTDIGMCATTSPIQSTTGSEDGNLKVYSRCFNCHSVGHISQHCPLPKMTICYNCHREGHKTFECASGKRCHLCLQLNHLARDCPLELANRSGISVSPTPSLGENVASNPSNEIESFQPSNTPDQILEQMSHTDLHLRNKSKLKRRGDGGKSSQFRMASKSSSKTSPYSSNQQILPDNQHVPQMQRGMSSSFQMTGEPSMYLLNDFGISPEIALTEKDQILSFASNGLQEMNPALLQNVSFLQPLMSQGLFQLVNDRPDIGTDPMAQPPWFSCGCCGNCIGSPQCPCGCLACSLAHSEQNIWKTVGEVNGSPSPWDNELDHESRTPSIPSHNDTAAHSFNPWTSSYVNILSPTNGQPDSEEKAVLYPFAADLDRTSAGDPGSHDAPSKLAEAAVHTNSGSHAINSPQGLPSGENAELTTNNESASTAQDSKATSGLHTTKLKSESSTAAAISPVPTSSKNPPNHHHHHHHHHRTRLLYQCPYSGRLSYIVVIHPTTTANTSAPASLQPIPPIHSTVHPTVHPSGIKSSNILPSAEPSKRFAYPHSACPQRPVRLQPYHHFHHDRLVSIGGQRFRLPTYATPHSRMPPAGPLQSVHYHSRHSHFPNPVTLDMQSVPENRLYPSVVCHPPPSTRHATPPTTTSSIPTPSIIESAIAQLPTDSKDKKPGISAEIIDKIETTLVSLLDMIRQAKLESADSLKETWDSTPSAETFPSQAVSEVLSANLISSLEKHKGRMSDSLASDGDPAISSKDGRCGCCFVCDVNFHLNHHQCGCSCNKCSCCPTEYSVRKRQCKVKNAPKDLEKWSLSTQGDGFSETNAADTYAGVSSEAPPDIRDRELRDVSCSTKASDCGFPNSSTHCAPSTSARFNACSSDCIPLTSTSHADCCQPACPSVPCSSPCPLTTSLVGSPSLCWPGALADTAGCCSDGAEVVPDCRSCAPCCSNTTAAVIDTCCPPPLFTGPAPQIQDKDSQLEGAQCSSPTTCCPLSSFSCGFGDLCVEEPCCSPLPAAQFCPADECVNCCTDSCQAGGQLLAQKQVPPVADPPHNRFGLSPTLRGCRLYSASFTDEQLTIRRGRLDRQQHSSRCGSAPAGTPTSVSSRRFE